MFKHPGTAPATLVFAKQIEALNFPVTFLDLGVGEVRGANRHVANQRAFRSFVHMRGGGVSVSVQGRFLEKQPGWALGVRKLATKYFGGVGLVNETIKVVGCIEVAKSLREARGRKRR